MGNKVKVANVVVNLAMGGIERLSIQLCAHLDPGRFDPVLICVEGGGPLEREAAEYGVNVVELGKNIKNVPGAVRSLSRLLRELEVDVVHGNPGLIARLAAPRSAVKVSTYHNFLRKRTYLSLMLDRHLTRRTDALVTITRSMAEGVEQRLRLKPGTFHVIYNGVDLSNVRLSARASSECRTDMKAPVVCFLGRLVPKKGAQVLLDAFSFVKNEIPSSNLWFIGDGEMSNELKSRAAPFGDAVLFWGRRLNPFPILSKADLYCLPSLHAPFELVAVEAMALGLPIVASRVDGIPEVVGDAAVLVKPGDPEELASAIISILTDERKARELSGKAEKRAAIFDIKKTAEQYGKVYEEALAVKRR